MSEAPSGESPAERAARWRAEEDAARETRWREHRARVLRATALAGTAAAAAMTVSAAIATAGRWALLPFVVAGYAAAFAVERFRFGTTRAALLTGALGIALSWWLGALFFVGWIGYPITGVVLAIWIGLARDD